MSHTDAAGLAVLMTLWRSVGPTQECLFLRRHRGLSGCKIPPTQDAFLSCHLKRKQGRAGFNVALGASVTGSDMRPVPVVIQGAIRPAWALLGAGAVSLPLACWALGQGPGRSELCGPSGLPSARGGGGVSP